MQRIRIRYTKEDRVRYVSARDMTSVWERALRRVDLPIAYSEGFSPHPKVSFPDALPVGFASTGEYAELTFAAPIDPGPDLGRLSLTLPGGMDITTFLIVPDGAPKLARMLQATLWEIELPAALPAAVERHAQALQQATTAMMAADTAEVIRHRPDGDRTLDVRPSVVTLRATSRRSSAGTIPVLRAVLRNDGPTIRPTDLYSALTTFLPFSGPPGADTADEWPQPRLHRRVAQGEATAEGLREALTQTVVTLDPERLAGAA